MIISETYLSEAGNGERGKESTIRKPCDIFLKNKIFLRNGKNLVTRRVDYFLKELV